MSEFRAELAGMSNEEILARLRTDGEFVSKALGMLVDMHPELIETTGPGIPIEEVAAEFNIDLNE